MNYLLMKWFNKYLNNEKGLGIIEIALIIVIIIGLAVLFKEKATELLEEIFNSIDIDTLNN